MRRARGDWSTIKTGEMSLNPGPDFTLRSHKKDGRSFFCVHDVSVNTRQKQGARWHINGMGHLRGAFTVLSDHPGR